MAPARNNRELAFAINDVARLLRTYADHEARRFGMTRAKWAVLARLDRFEGLKQAELAEMLDLQPISLTRLLDGLADNGLIERRPDPDDRRAKRLFLTPAARPLLGQLTELGEDLMATALAGFAPADTAALLASLGAIKENLRQAVQKKSAGKPDDQEQRYG
jgi:MarR family transcriptional regulator, transcriptional regulator for hemolysin